MVTTRYFGGILLGAGGLTRAYAGAAHLALTAAGVAEFVPFTDFLIDCAYSDHPKIENELARMGVSDTEATFSDRVLLRVGVPTEQGEALCRRMVELTAGRCVPTEIGKRMGAK